MERLKATDNYKTAAERCARRQTCHIQAPKRSSPNPEKEREREEGERYALVNQIGGGKCRLQHFTVIKIARTPQPGPKTL